MRGEIVPPSKLIVTNKLSPRFVLLGGGVLLRGGDYIRNICIHMYTHVCVYIYIYIYIYIYVNMRVAAVAARVPTTPGAPMRRHATPPWASTTPCGPINVIYSII